MRRLILVALLLVFAAPVEAQWSTSPVNATTETTDNFTGGATMVATIPATTIGNTIVIVVISNQNRSVSSVTCGGTFSSIHRQGVSVFIQVMAAVATSSVTSCTVVLTGNSDSFIEDVISVLEFSGGAATLTESGTSTGTTNASTTTSHDAASVTPNTSSTLFIGALVIDGSTGGLTTDSDFTQVFTETAGAPKWIGYFVQNGATTAQAFNNTTVTSRRSWILLAALEGSAAAGGKSHNCLLLGVC